jgi:hypothetical protein
MKAVRVPGSFDARWLDAVVSTMEWTARLREIECPAWPVAQFGTQYPIDFPARPSGPCRDFRADIRRGRPRIFLRPISEGMCGMHEENPRGVEQLDDSPRSPWP